MNNILGKIEGKNPNEYVIIGAHYDHLGFDPMLDGDRVYNGADDNASGVSVVLQVAKAFLATGFNRSEPLFSPSGMVKRKAC